MAARHGIIVGVAAGCAVAVAAVAASGRLSLDGVDNGGARLIQTAATSTMFAPPPGAPMSFADIFDKVAPAVVSIEVRTTLDTTALQQFQFPNPFGGNPFGLAPGGRQGQQAQPPQAGRGAGRGQTTPGGRAPTDEDSPIRRREGAGSGFLISADGYIVTNNHVIDDADQINVTLEDGRKLPARVVGTDEYTDLAVLKIEGGQFSYVDFENKAKPRVGDWVITVGNPFRLGGSATAGIVSAFGRNNLGGGNDDLTSSYVDYIQIDAPINMGNSGGPTFDIYGRVIGVNAAIYSPTGGSIGIGFAIPADIAESIAKQIIANGRVTRGYIGASISDFTADDAQALGLGTQRGGMVMGVTCNGPSARAGLQINDIVTQVNGVDIKSSSELTREVAKVSPGGAVRLSLLRDGQRRTLTITSGARPSAEDLSRASDDCPTQVASATRGGAGEPATATGDRILGMALAPNPDGGVVVEAVRNTSDAANKGLSRSDVITAVNLRPVNQPAQVAAAVAEARRAGRPSVLLSLASGGRVTVLLD